MGILHLMGRSLKSYFSGQNSDFEKIFRTSFFQENKEMSAKKNQSILNFFSKKPSSATASSSPSQCQPKNLVSTFSKSDKVNEGGDKKQDSSQNKSQEELDLEDLARSCLEDDDEGMDVIEPEVEKKKRK